MSYRNKLTIPDKIKATGIIWATYEIVWFDDEWHYIRGIAELQILFSNN